MKRPPKMVVIVALVIALGLVVVGLIAWQYQVQEKNDCQRSVDARNDSRAMWLYAIGAAEEPNAPEVRAFAKKLNELLPPLHCVDGNLTKPTD